MSDIEDIQEISDVESDIDDSDISLSPLVNDDDDDLSINSDNQDDIEKNIDVGTNVVGTNVVGTNVVGTNVVGTNVVDTNLKINQPYDPEFSTLNSTILNDDNIDSDTSSLNDDTKVRQPPLVYSDSDSDDDEVFDNKFELEGLNDLLINYHPQSKQHNYDEIYTLSKVTRDNNGIIIDPLHKTLPILSKYEKTRILGQRAKQIDSGNKPFVNIDKPILDGYLIAEEELKQKKLPFIIRRPLPNGGSEYWRVSDLEILY